MEIAGSVDRTYVRGQLVFDSRASEPFLSKPIGQLLL